MSLNKRFAKYISQNVMGMLGMSAYILADTFFLARAAGANGLTAVNLALPIYSLIDAIAITVSVGSAIRFNIARARGEDSADRYFINALYFDLLIGLLFFLVGLTTPDTVLRLMGADDTIVQVGHGYMKTVLLFAPGFASSFAVSSFIRNDHNPGICMISMLISSLFNIVMDYVFMFPLGMGITGAALATGMSPILGMLINCSHFFTKKNTIRFRLSLPSPKLMLHGGALGISAGVSEITSGLTTTVFNYLTLWTAGNVGVAAYSVVANYALIASSIFNGIAQGAQPLISESYAQGDDNSVKHLFRLSNLTSLGTAALLIGFVYLCTAPLVALFNAEGNNLMGSYTITGMRIYFLGYLFAGCNIIGTGYLSATEKAKSSFTASLLRGCVILVIVAILLAVLFGLKGVWIAFPAAEFLSLGVILFFVKSSRIRNLKA